MPRYGTDDGFARFLGEAAERSEDPARNITAELLEEIRALRRELRAVVENGAPLMA